MPVLARCSTDLRNKVSSLTIRKRLADAERDPAYREYTDLSLPPPPSPSELAASKGVKLPQATDYSAKLAAMCGAAVSKP